MDKLNKKIAIDKISDLYYFFYNQHLNDKITYFEWERIKEAINDIKKIVDYQ